MAAVAAEGGDSILGPLPPAVAIGAAAAAGCCCYYVVVPVVRLPLVCVCGGGAGDAASQ